MAISKSGTSIGITELVEKRMNSWRAGETKPEGTSAGKEKKVKFYIAISRECGCNADNIASKLEERTGFHKYDQEILNFIAKNDEVRRKLFELIDDRTMGWIESICSVLSLGPTVNEEEFFSRLTHEVLAICHSSHAIIIGRAANFILPREQGLAVRLVAPRDYRLEKFAKRMNLDLKTALMQMERIDAGRGDFVETHFGKYAFDPRRYDLVINVSQYTDEQVVDLIMLALQAKAGDSLVLPVTQGPMGPRHIL
jgi:cytidylate kinase